MFDREILSWLEYGGRSCKIFWSDCQKFHSLLYSWILWFDLIVSLFPSGFLLFPWLLCHDSFLQWQLPIGVLKQGVLRNLTKFTGNHLYESIFFIFIKKDTLAQVFSSEFCEISKNSFLRKTPIKTVKGKYDLDNTTYQIQTQLCNLCFYRTFLWEPILFFDVLYLNASCIRKWERSLFIFQLLDFNPRFQYFLRVTFINF